MQIGVKIGIVVLVLAGIAGAVALKSQRSLSPAATPGPLAETLATAQADGAVVDQAAPAALPAPAAEAPAPLPRLVDLGAGKCIPCKLMAPILADLRQEYAGRLRVEFIDVWVNPAAAEPYGIRAIPTQIFYAANGKELARHEGFLAKADILAQWQALGVPLAAATAVPASVPAVPPASASAPADAPAAAMAPAPAAMPVPAAPRPPFSAPDGDDTPSTLPCCTK